MTYDESPESLPELIQVGDMLIADRRADARHSFPLLQKVRPIVVEGLDGRGRFVRCHDLSESGVSFWSPEAFLTDRMTMTLGEDDAQVEVDLEICHSTPITCLQDPLYLIGGRFIGP